MTKQNAHKFKPFVEALIAGKDISCNGRVLTKVNFNMNPVDYAIVEPPSKVPLTYEDMEPGCHFKIPSRSGVFAVTRYDSGGVKLDNTLMFIYEDLLDAEIYRPSTQQWSPAHK